ncbi:potassium-transporting ATPase subunit KdpA [Oleispirillum naphthae]|uniref:potassium-transporting ATPase subunit KdpA n=1 Tax=Oleispirillum naphthae TaxID=2838853 RepID=UPI00308235C8
MDANGILQILLYLAVIVALTPLAGGYMARLFEGRLTFLAWAERPIYRLCGTAPEREQHWSAYAFSLLAFNLVGTLAVYGLERLQVWLPLNPAGVGAVSPTIAFNTAVSFATNTNWQAYGGETAMSYLTQMAGLAVQNFVSAATGIAVAVALIRGFARHSAQTVGNFTVDLTRCVLYLLLPVAFLTALFLVWQGAPQNFDAYVPASTLEGVHQLIAQGPVASQEAIKQLGSNGGGFFNANSAHPFENPTPLTNLVEMTFLLLLAAGLTDTFGRMVGDRRQGWAIFAAMGLMFVVCVSLAAWAESQANPALTVAGMDSLVGNMEGKEVRFGIANSAIWATATTAASNGSVNAMHDSFMPLGGLVPLVDILLGEVIFGGVGAGLYGMLVFVVLAVFIAGLMVGRTPEYLGKKIEAREVKLAVLAILVTPLGVLGLGAISLLAGPEAIAAPGPHGLSELLYAYASATGNNGSAFAGFGAATPLNAILQGVAMVFGRFAVIVPVLAIAGSAAAKKTVPPSAGTLPTHGRLFVTLLIAVTVVVGGLTFFPALALGPVVEHLALFSGTLF